MLIFSSLLRGHYSSVSPELSQTPPAQLSQGHYSSASPELSQTQPAQLSQRHYSPASPELSQTQPAQLSQTPVQVTMEVTAKEKTQAEPLKKSSKSLFRQGKEQFSPAQWNRDQRSGLTDLTDPAN